jgi:hypothetical protein
MIALGGLAMSGSDEVVTALEGARRGPGPHVPPNKMVRIYVVLCLIFFITGAYVGVDWASYLYGFASEFSRYAGYVRTILCIILALMTREHCIEAAVSKMPKIHKDGVLLLLAFMLTGLADVFLLLLDWMTTGTALFLVVHGLLTVRHATQLSRWFEGPKPTKDVIWLAATAVVIGAFTFVFFTQVRSLIEPTGMLGLFGVYLVVLAVSLWVAFSTKVNPFFPRANALQIMVGMVCFFFCDITVGLAFVLKGTETGAILDNLVAFFYTPALVLLALSGYRWPGTIAGVLPAPSPAPDAEDEPGRMLFPGTMAQYTAPQISVQSADDDPAKIQG